MATGPAWSPLRKHSMTSRLPTSPITCARPGVITASPIPPLDGRQLAPAAAAGRECARPTALDCPTVDDAVLKPALTADAKALRQAARDRTQLEALVGAYERQRPQSSSAEVIEAMSTAYCRAHHGRERITRVGHRRCGRLRAAGRPGAGVTSRAQRGCSCLNNPVRRDRAAAVMIWQS